MFYLDKNFLAVCLCAALCACSGTPEAGVAGAGQTIGESRNSTAAFSADKLRLTGRFDFQSDRARFIWPGSAVAFRFRGTAAAIAIASAERVRFSVTVDGVESDLWINSGEHIYTLARDLEAGVHDVKLTRLTESFSGITALISEPIVNDETNGKKDTPKLDRQELTTPGELLSPPPPSRRRLVVFGDSITAGYGVEGSSASCGYALETSNPLKAYAAIAAQKLDADLHIVAYSGIGAWRSYGEKVPTNPTIIDRYSLTLTNNPETRWNPAAFMPDAVVVAIGTNDFWDGEGGQYAQAMREFLQALQKDYPDTPIYTIVSPMLNGAVREQQKNTLVALSQTYQNVNVLDLGQITAADGYGCDYHPNVTTQSRMAENLVETLSVELKWPR